MSEPREAAVRALFEQASALDGEERARLLRDSRQSDPALADEVESLLTFHDTHDAVLDAPPVTPALRPGQPARIGAYEVLSEIGRGGMGVVYEARQASPRRLVALKVISDSGQPDQLARRLEREAEMLALLDHPGIARVYEAGVAPDHTGRPTAFVAMELVRGPTLRELARETRIPLARKLELAAKIADGVDHAHRRGIVHRDLKPENIIVLNTEGPAASQQASQSGDAPPASSKPRNFGAGVPKILDFGIARLTSGNSGSIAATLAGQIVGTLEFMSPEQAAGDPRHIDTRCDVYSLGAILHELLVGTPPISLAGMSITSAIAAICQQPPARLGAIDPALAGDIEAIVAKALDKEPALRYASASEFAADIRRYLADQPVLARASTPWYQFVRFARRRRGLVAGVTLALCGLLLTSTIAVWQASRATRARDQAASEALRATQTADFLRRMLLMATPERSAGRELTVRELLDASSRDLAATQGLSPQVEADTHQLFAEAYLALGEFSRSEEHARLAIRAAELAGGPEGELALRASAQLGLAIANQHRGQDAAAMLDAALVRARAVLGPRSPVVVDLLRAKAACAALQPGPRLAEAEEAAREGLRISLETLGEDDDRTVVLTQMLATALGLSGNPAKIEEAIRLDRDLLASRSRHLGDEHPRALFLSVDLAQLLGRVGRRLEVVELLQARLPVARRVLGAEHVITMIMEDELAENFHELRRYDEALPLRQHVYEQRLRRLGAGSLETIVARDALVEGLVVARRCDQAATVIEEQEQAKKILGEGNIEPRLTYLRFLLADCTSDRAQMERYAERLRGTGWEQLTRAVLERARPADAPPPGPGSRGP